MGIKHYRTLTSIKKVMNKFHRYQYAADYPEDESKHELLGAPFDRCGLFFDIEMECLLKIGDFVLVEQHFNSVIEKYKQANVIETFPGLRLYDISSMSAIDIDMMLKISTGVSKRLAKYPNIPVTEPKIYDECVVLN